MTSVRLNDAEVAAIRGVIRTTVRRYVHDPHVAEDLCHDALARVLRAAPGLDDSVLHAYANVVTRNTLHSHYRAERNRAHKQLRAGAVATQTVPGPDEEAFARLDPSEETAMRNAFAQLSDADRELLDAVDIDETAVASISRHGFISPGTIRVRLLRARARLRTRYLVELRGVELTGPQCLLVLDALSTGDRSRQRALHAQEHLDVCAACASIAEPIRSRRRPTLLILMPIAGAWRWLRNHPGHVAVGTVATAGLSVAAFTAFPREAPPEPPAAAAPTTTAAAPSLTTMAPASLRSPTGALLPVPADIAARAGQAVTAAAAAVNAVVGDEAFWVGTSDADRLLVIVTGGSESAPTITAGQHVSFTGTLVPNVESLAADAGIDASEGADLLTTQGLHIEVDETSITLS